MWEWDDRVLGTAQTHSLGITGRVIDTRTVEERYTQRVGSVHGLGTFLSCRA